MQFLEENFFLRFGSKITRAQEKFKVKILAFYDAWYAAMPPTDGRTDIIPEFNASLIGRGKKEKIIIFK